MSGRDIGIGILVIGAMLLGFVAISLLIGWTNSIRPVCAAGERAISVDGSRSRVGKTLVTPDADYPICTSRMKCPFWAIHPDGSALTDTCVAADCPCSAFRICPAYASTIFRQFGRDDRISLFQIVDPLAREADLKPENPNDPPYLLLPGSVDSCFLNDVSIKTVWPAIALGDRCIRGTLARIKTNPKQFVCAPTRFVEKTAGGDFLFNIDAYPTLL